MAELTLQLQLSDGMVAEAISSRCTAIDRKDVYTDRPRLSISTYFPDTARIDFASHDCGDYISHSVDLRGLTLELTGPPPQTAAKKEKRRPAGPVERGVGRRSSRCVKRQTLGMTLRSCFNVHLSVTR